MWCEEWSEGIAAVGIVKKVKPRRKTQMITATENSLQTTLRAAQQQRLLLKFQNPRNALRRRLDAAAPPRGRSTRVRASFLAAANTTHPRTTSTDDDGRRSRPISSSEIAT